jgi:hypothetical protein
MFMLMSINIYTHTHTYKLRYKYMYISTYSKSLSIDQREHFITTIYKDKYIHMYTHIFIPIASL